MLSYFPQLAGGDALYYVFSIHFLIFGVEN